MQRTIAAECNLMREKGRALTKKLIYTYELKPQKGKIKPKKLCGWRSSCKQMTNLDIYLTMQQIFIIIYIIKFSIQVVKQLNIQ